MFVCRNRRPAGGRPSCDRSGARDVLRGFEGALAARTDWWGRVRITETGCLGPCFDGPTVVVYPRGRWYGGVTADDAAAILEANLAGGPEPTDLVLALDQNALDQDALDHDE